MFKIGDKVIVCDEYELQRGLYPFLPDLVSKQGEVVEVKGDGLDEFIYCVKFEPFKIGVIAEGGHSIDEPTEWRDECLFCFTEYDLAIVEN